MPKEQMFDVGSTNHQIGECLAIHKSYFVHAAQSHLEWRVMHKEIDGTLARCRKLCVEPDAATVAQCSMGLPGLKGVNADETSDRGVQRKLDKSVGIDRGIGKRGLEVVAVVMVSYHQIKWHR